MLLDYFESTMSNNWSDPNFGNLQLIDPPDSKYFIKWVDRVKLVRESVQSVIYNKFKTKFDWFPLAEDITLANLAYNQAINLVNQINIFPVFNKVYFK